MTPQQGVAIAEFTGADGHTFAVIVPATFYRGHFFLDADSQQSALFALRAAGVEETEFEFFADDETESV